MQEIVQSTLDKVRALSQALHPVVLDEVGFEGALDQYLPGFEKQTGIEVRYEKYGASRELDRGVAIHLYRVMQEALNNVARHSQSEAGRGAPALSAGGRGARSGGRWRRVSEARKRHGMGLVSMRERAELVNGRLSFWKIAVRAARWCG